MDSRNRNPSYIIKARVYIYIYTKLVIFTCVTPQTWTRIISWEYSLIHENPKYFTKILTWQTVSSCSWLSHEPPFFCFCFFSPLTINYVKIVSLVIISVSLISAFCTFPSRCGFLLGLVHCSRDPQILFSTKTTLKLGFTTLFTHLKIILL